MSEIIDHAISEIKELKPVKENNVSDDCAFGIVCYKYFYNDGIYDNSDFDISYTDGTNDGGVDLIGISESDINLKSMVLIQSKNTTSSGSTKPVIKDYFNKMARTVDDFKRKDYSHLNTNLQRIYLNTRDEADNDLDNTIELTVFLGHDKSENEKKAVLEYLEKEEALNSFNLSIYYKSEIENQIEILEQKPKWVPHGELDFYHKHGVLEKGDFGILVDAKALSLREFYVKYKKNGLFEQNYRYFITQKKIDAQITNSLEKKRDKFWYMNNGIIIACKDFRIDGNKIKLTDFSIVNGCQTTTLIGDYSGKNASQDFPIACKIVKPEDSNSDEDFQAFIQEIAEASNSQKPISDKDLKSNDIVQKRLQLLLKRNDPKVYLEIKRGEKFKGTRRIESWRKVKNDVLGQLILSFVLQKPGTARSSKKKIFSEKTTYENIFHKNREKAFLVDLLQLSDLYTTWLNNNKITNIEEKTTAKNGKLSVIALVGFLIKHQRGLIDTSLSSDLWKVQAKEDNIDLPFLNTERATDNAIFSLFNKLVQLLKREVTSRGEEYTSISNFFKSDVTYLDVILEAIEANYLRYEEDFEDIKKSITKAFII